MHSYMLLSLSLSSLLLLPSGGAADTAKATPFNGEYFSGSSVTPSGGEHLLLADQVVHHIRRPPRRAATLGARTMTSSTSRRTCGRAATSSR